VAPPPHGTEWFLGGVVWGGWGWGAWGGCGFGGGGWAVFLLGVLFSVSLQSFSCVSRVLSLDRSTIAARSLVPQPKF